jgi:hypothetical protein
MGRRYLVQEGLPFNPKTGKIDLNVALDENGPFIAMVKNYKIVEKDKETIDLIPELVDETEPEEIEQINDSLPLYERQERARKQRLMARKTQKRGKK